MTTNINTLRDILMCVVFTTIGCVLGLMLSVAVFSPENPNCPTEDSCTIDYHDGQWHVTDDTP